MKNILIFSTAYLPLIGGAEIAVKEITDRISSSRFDLITAKIKPGLPNFERINNINIYRVGFGLGFLDKLFLPIFGLLKALKLNREKKYQIIWSIMASQAGVAAVFFKIFSRKKLILTLQEGDPESHLQRYTVGIKIIYWIFIKPWHMLPFKYADYLTVISQYLKSRALRNGVKEDLIEIIPNGVDLNVFRPDTEIRSLQRSDLKFKILTVSRLVKKNGIDDLIKAGQYLNFPFKIVIIGDGSDRDKFEELTRKLNLEDKIVFKGGVDHRSLVRYYTTSDVFVRASLSEGLGISFLESLASGLPIIGTQVGGIPDFLKDKKTGLFCKINNPKSIAEKIKEIVENDNLRDLLIKNGLKLVRDKYNWDKIGLNMEKVFKRI